MDTINRLMTSLQPPHHKNAISKCSFCQTGPQTVAVNSLTTQFQAHREVFQQ